MNEPTTLYVLLKPMPWNSIKAPDGKPLTVLTQAAGYLAFFDTLDQLQSEHPGAAYLKLTASKNNE